MEDWQHLRVPRLPQFRRYGNVGGDVGHYDVSEVKPFKRQTRLNSAVKQNVNKAFRQISFSKIFFC